MRDVSKLQKLKRSRTILETRNRQRKTIMSRHSMVNGVQAVSQGPPPTSHNHYIRKEYEKLKISFAQLTSTWNGSAPTKRASCQGQSPGEGMCLNYFSETINDSCQRKSPKTKASINASQHSAELIFGDPESGTERWSITQCHQTRGYTTQKFSSWFFLLFYFSFNCNINNPGLLCLPKYHCNSLKIKKQKRTVPCKFY